MGAKFGSAIMTSCPRTSRDRATHSLSVEASMSMRAPGPVPEHGGETRRLGADAPLDDLTVLGEDVDLAFPLVDIDANMVHGWPLLSAALTARVLLWGTICHHVKREASRFIPSIR
jgi:hypothetical protein